MKKSKKWMLAAAALCLAAVAVSLAVIAMVPRAANSESMKLLTDTYRDGRGAFTIDDETRFFMVTDQPDADFTQVSQLISQQFAANGTPSSAAMPIVWGSEEQIRANDIVLKLDDSVLSSEGYQVDVDSKNIRITGADHRGLMYGAFTVIKYLRANESSTIAGCTITDEPDAAERTVMLDCGRKYFTPQWIKNFIREMAYMGYNTIELHFSDDQGTRFDIWDPEYYTTNVNGNDFSWVCGGYVGSWVKDIYHDYPDKREYLTAQEIDEIMTLAAQYQMDVIPAMDSPGHCQYLCLTYGNNATISQKFHYNGKTYYFRGVSSNGTLELTQTELKATYPNTDFSEIFAGNQITLDVTNPYGRAFILAIIEDYARFFRQYGCDTFHIGGDEVRLSTNAYGPVKWSDYVQPGYSKYDTCIDYINEQTAMLKELGYTVRAFNDFIDYVSDDPDYDQHIAFDPDIEISYWIGQYDLETAPTVEHFLGQRNIYNCLQNYCYYSLTESASGNDGRDPETKNWDFYYSTADRIYEYWNPTVFQWPEDPGLGTVVDPAQVSGGYFLIWCDNAAQSTQEQIWNGVDEQGTYNVTDRMWSNIVKMWNYDIHETLNYEEYSALRQKLGHFPGYTGCADETNLPQAQEISPA